MRRRRYDPNRRRTYVPPDVAKALGMTEKDRLDLATGQTWTISELIQELEEEHGTGDPPKKPEEEKP